MTFLLVLLFGVCATASSAHDDSKEALQEVDNIKHRIAQALPLHLTLDIEDSDAIKRQERDAKEEITKYLEDAFEKILRKIDLAFKEGKPINKEAVKKLRELKDKMNELEIEDDAVVDEFKEQLDSHLRQILEKMGILD